ncbi:hypothetical protein RUM44_014042 [Polyplax serrata]|uniref:Uncharacterized protein n=1 Tax=Polyplax serrata TaxID=468196 RepID=A0ABR1BHP7_POLSC
MSDIGGFMSSILFAVHPIHTEAVTGVVGRAETLSSVFFLLAFILYTKAAKQRQFMGWKYLIPSMCCVKNKESQSLAVQRDDIGAHINVGRTYKHLKMFKKAEEVYLRAKSLLPKAKPGESYQARIAPNHLNVFLNLTNLIAKNETRLEEVDLLYRQAISMRADYTHAYINRGGILLKLNRTKETQEVYERALSYDSNNPDIYYKATRLAVVFLEQGKASQALVYLDKALEFDPDHEPALLNSAFLLQELGRVELRKIARERL